ncbi:MAG: hypothetical protein HY280_00090 [Nitrospinae bacterium]|nr:hypothetical protein [Nitrospinota bacterium]
MKYTDARKQAMYDWFHENFSEPQFCDPVESESSGYQYVCGGPYFAREIISSQYSAVYPEDVVREVIKDLEDESSEWIGRKTAAMS